MQRGIDALDSAAIAAAIEAAQADPRPSIIGCKSVIGYGSPNRAGTSKVHGEPLGDDELKAHQGKSGLATGAGILRARRRTRLL